MSLSRGTGLPYVLALIKREGIYNLGGYDGCACTHFCLTNIFVDVSCHKSGGCIDCRDKARGQVHVYCRSLGEADAACREIAEEVLRQVLDGHKDYYSPDSFCISLHEPKYARDPIRP